MRARSSFYVCAGILLLVVAYSIGARQAGAQSGPQLVDMDGVGFPLLAIDSSKRLIQIYENSVSIRSTCPGSGTPVAVLQFAGDAFVAMDNGDVWRWINDMCGPEPCQRWELFKNAFGESPVQVQGKSMSEVKSTYRGK